MKDATYHEAAIEYNDSVALVCEELADSPRMHPIVAKWCRSVAKQHRFHEKRHRAALEKLLSNTAVAEKEQQNG